MDAAFRLCTNLTVDATDAPLLDSLDNKSLSNMFAWSGINGNIDNWDVSSVMNMSGMFSGAKTFNQNIGGWNTSSVTDMSNMFFNAWNFDGAIGSWDVSSVTNMGGMFSYALAFNQPMKSTQNL